MTDKNSSSDRSRQSALFMDVLSHDVLNNNQAVLSYLELILASPEMSPRSRNYAEKAVSHIRASTVLVEDANRLIAARALDVGALKPFDLLKAVDYAKKELGGYFPARRIRVHMEPGPKDMFVLGDTLVQYLVLNAFLDMVKVDSADNVDVTVRGRKSELNGKICWSLTLSDANAKLLPSMKSDLPELYTQDSSKTVKLAGFLFVKTIAELLGGKFEARELVGGAKKKETGVEFVLTLAKGGTP